MKKAPITKVMDPITSPERAVLIILGRKGSALRGEERSLP